ncbi:MAG: 30S ribosomal protein S16 [uncultured bacterium]|nr:MAG: 30S ribosomal protein S16 [uncultured bacterium]
MAVVIRLRRIGHKKAPYYRIVVTDSRNKRDGRFIETLGMYQPISPDHMPKFTIEKERCEYWISQGAQPTDTVWSMLKKSGIPKPLKQKKKAATAEAPVKEKKVKANTKAKKVKA